jgi:hypothetical protein
MLAKYVKIRSTVALFKVVFDVTSTKQRPTFRSSQFLKRNHILSETYRWIHNGQQVQSRGSQFLHRSTTVALQMQSLNIVKRDTQIVVSATVLVGHGHVDDCLVDARILGKFSVLLQVSGLICRVLVDNVDLFVLKVALAD